MTAQPKTIATARTSERLRERSVNVDARKLLVSRLDGSDQEDDLAVPQTARAMAEFGISAYEPLQAGLQIRSPSSQPARRWASRRLL